MEIQVGENKLEYQLEKEENLLEVFESLERWLYKNKKMVEEIEVDGTLIEITRKEDLKSKFIDGTHSMKLKTLSWIEYGSKHLLELKEYLEKLLKGAKDTVDVSKRIQIIQGMHWIQEVLVEIIKILHLDMGRICMGGKSLLEFISKHHEYQKILKENQYNGLEFQKILQEKVEGNLEDLLKILPKILVRAIFEGSHFDEIGKESLISNIEYMKKDIQEFKPKLLEVGIDLQSDDKAKAYCIIQNFLGMLINLVHDLQKLEAYLKTNYESWNISDTKISDLNKDFKNLLEELHSAFQQKDLILLGDILEYEILEKLDIYDKVFEKFIAIIETKL